MAKQDQTPTTDDAAAGGVDMGAMVGQLLTDAQALKDEKDALVKRTKANRDMLRNLVGGGYASDEQAASVKKFYPREGKKKDDAATAAPDNSDAS